jgi:capsular exopolysaccharide synthesis family protein
LACSPHGDPDLIEQFRRLAAILQQAQRSNGLRSVMLTSAVAGDGKTLTAVNLALVLSESYRCKVLLIDADLRRPSIPSVWELSEGLGLSDALRATNEQKLALVPVTPTLTLLPAGHRVANSIEALTSPRMHQILDEATSRFDWVILDAPPVGLTADARVLTELVGGTLFVVHAGYTQCADVQKAIDTLGRDNILGIVLNGVERRPARGYYGVRDIPVAG